MDNPPELVDLVTFDRDLADTMLQQYPGLIFENQYSRSRLSGKCRFFRLGKSTLLKAVEGTQCAIEGDVFLDGHKILLPNRNVGMVHQDYNLYDFLTAEEINSYKPNFNPRLMT